jgi:hypothetical protein
MLQVKDRIAGVDGARTLAVALAVGGRKYADPPPSVLRAYRCATATGRISS